MTEEGEVSGSGGGGGAPRIADKVEYLQYGGKRSVTIFGFETQTRERVIQLGTYLPYEPW